MITSESRDHTIFPKIGQALALISQTTYHSWDMKYTTEENQSLLEALAKLSPESSQTTRRSWLKDGRITVDGEVVRVGSTPVRKGQTVVLGAKSRVIGGNIRIIYEDKHFVIIDKPEGMLSVSTAFEKKETAHALLKEKYRPQRVHVVHRLDQDTSGVMLFALTEEARDQMKKLFEKHEIERAYTAIVEGVMEQEKGIWECYLYEDGNYVVHPTDDEENGELAITHYAVKGRNRRHTQLELKLETGKKNQIRVHCQMAGHPIVGDKKYGAKSSHSKRLCLHAHLLAFVHPVTHKKVRFESPLPETFDRIIESRGV